MTRHWTTPIRILFIVALAFALCREVQAATVYVAPGGTNDPPYATWSAAATNIQYAIDVAIAGDVVLVSNGTYILSQQIILTNGITVSSVNGRDFTIIDGNASDRCILISHSNALLEGFTIRNGSTSSDLGGSGVILIGGGVLHQCIITGNNAYSGGGVYCLYGGVVRDCLIGKNHGYYGGGALLDQGGVLQDCALTENDAGIAGSGVYLSYGGTLESCHIANNSGFGTGGGIFFNQGGSAMHCDIVSNLAYNSSGGGLRMYYGGTASNCTIRGNSARYTGGGATLTKGIITHCVIAENMVTDTSQARGGGANMDDSATIRWSTIWSNSSANSGGGVKMGEPGDRPGPTLLNSTIAYNMASQVYGGINVGEKSEAANCTIYGNVANAFGAGAISGGGLLRNSTIANNISSTGACLNIYYGRLANSIVYFNSPSNVEVTALSAVTNVANVCTIPPMTGIGIMTNNPQFVDQVTDEFHLTAFSPCVDAGTNVFVALGDLDIDGDQRIFNGIVDIGADEASVACAQIEYGNNAFTRWHVPIAGTFQLQRCSMLLSGDWTDLGQRIGSTGQFLVVSDDDATNGAAFYRLLWQR